MQMICGMLRLRKRQRLQKSKLKKPERLALFCCFSSLFHLSFNSAFLIAKVVQGLRINFDSKNFENPALQKHYSNLQDIALGRPIREEVVDYAIPDTDGLLNQQI